VGSTTHVDHGAPPAAQVRALLDGEHPDPHAVLGPHQDDGGAVVRVLRPGADTVDVLLPDGTAVPLATAHPGGLFSARLPAPPGRYRLLVRTGDRVEVVDEGYRLPPVLDRHDRRAIAEGAHRRLWRVLGAHRRTRVGGEDVDGVAFAVWAPHARGVRVRGDFDGWDGRAHPMRLLADCGVWELFVPGVADGARYRFEVLGADGRWREKADPAASAAECPPANASVVHTSGHTWRDSGWLARRAATDPATAPLSAYEVHLGSWLSTPDGWPDYRALAHALADHVTALGFTHVELLPVAEHPFTGSWGYQVTSHFAPTARFGDPDGFRYLVDHLHRRGIGVLLDFVPAHFPRDDWALARFDGTALYEHPDPRRGEHPDWGTLVFDFGRPQVRDFLVSAALHWIEEYHVDGLRVDAVSSMLYLDYSRGDGQWLPNEHGGRENLEACALLRELTAAVHREHPGVLVVAEESTAWPGVTSADGLGFDLKWNMGWMHDVLDHVSHDPADRPAVHDRLAFSFSYAWSERYVLPLSHDEVVHGKGSLWARTPGDEAVKAAGLRLLLAHTWAHPGKQLLFMGGELGQPGEWDADGSPPWHLAESPPHRDVLRLVARLNGLHRALPALHVLDHSPDGFRWVSGDAEGGVLAFLRLDGHGSVLLCAENFSATAHRCYRVGVPAPGPWSVVLDTEAIERRDAVMARPVPWQGMPASVELDLAPSSALWLEPAGVRRK
jgi:1,4-alpha-glucan branching enzyme